MPATMLQPWERGRDVFRGVEPGAAEGAAGHGARSGGHLGTRLENSAITG